MYAKLFPEAEYWIMLVVKQAGMQWQKTQTRKKPLSWISWTIYWEAVHINVEPLACMYNNIQ
jgi:hypothetical protein